MSISASLKSNISQMMNDGLSNREILKEVNKILKGQGKDTLHYMALNKIINSLMDDLVPTFESDEEDEEYVPSESEESDEEYVPSESEDSEEESEDEEYVPSESEEETPKTSPRMKICSYSPLKTKIPKADRKATPLATKAEDKFIAQKEDMMYIYLNRPLEVDEDRIVIHPTADGFKVQYEYNRNPVPTQVHEFVGDANAVLEYLSDVICLLCIDQKPYTEVEFLIPFYPNISITPNNFTGIVASTILRAVGAYLDHYEE